MSAYRLPHDLAGEQQRLALMSALLDTVERVTIDRLGVGPGWRCLELGSRNGSIARILAQLVGPTGHVVASDIDLSFMACRTRWKKAPMTSSPRVLCFTIFRVGRLPWSA